MYVGIDIGTQSLKALVVDEGLQPRGRGRVAYQPSHPKPGWAEQDPRLWLSGLRPAIGQALQAARLAPSDIKGLAVCGQLDGCVGATADGEPVAPAIIWMDRRASEAIDGLDAEQVWQRAGLVLDTTHMGAKIRWSMRHLRSDAVTTWHQPVSFVVDVLTGERVMDHSLASTTMLYGLAERDWHDPLLVAFDVDRRSLPRIADAGDVAGRLGARGASLTGLLMGLPVAVGTGDDFSNPLGSGIAEPGTISVTLGTGEAIGGISQGLVLDETRLLETHAYPGGHYHLGNPGWLSGGAVAWFLTTFGVKSVAEMTALAARVPPGSEGVIFLPALSGATAPRWSSSMRGCFHGMTAAHGKEHLARAVLEGTSFAMRDVVDRLGVLGIGESVRILGGGAASRLWTQIRADVLGRDVEALEEGDASAMGAAMLAAVAGGGATSVRSACAQLALPLRCQRANHANRAAYDDAYGGYRRLFDALEPLAG